MSSETKLRVGLVGCGKIADAHVEEIGKMANAELVGVCDKELLMAEQVAVRYQIASYYDDLGKLLAEKAPDVIHVTTPPQSHLALATQAIDGGCHVYVEKPFAVNADEARRLIEHAERAARRLTVGYIYQFDPATLALRGLIAQGRLGDVVHVESHFGYDLDGPFGAAILGNAGHWVHELPGGLFQNNLDHALAKTLEFVTDPRPAVRAFGYRLRTKTFGDIRDQLGDELRVILIGKKTSAYVTFCSHAKPITHFLRLYGTKNVVTVNYVTRTLTVDRAPKFPSAIGRLLPPFAQGWDFLGQGGRNIIRFARSDFHFFAGMNRLLRLFYDSIGGEGPLPISYRDIMRVSETSDEIFEQIKQTLGAEAK